MSDSSVPSAQRRALVISYGPVPTPQYQTIEGGGMRAWGLAEGLKSHGIEVTVGVNASFPQELSEHEGIGLQTWSLDGDFKQLINSFDAVVVSYCMGDPSVFVADNLSDDVQLILDCYVPIYIEVSARDSKDVESEYVNYMADLARHNHTLRRGDYFLYANDAQELLYSGVLSALGVINPAAYRTKRLIKAPFGIHRLPVVAKQNPYMALGITDKDFVVLWFGGIYPWFRIEEYLEAITELSKDAAIKFVFVGGKNPFNPNPDFSRQYDTAVQFATQKKLLDRQVFFVDWVDFDTRVEWFVHCDVVVSLNQPGDENKYSWRTRVMDFVWGKTVTITNGGDPLSEELIAAGGALKLDGLDSKYLVDAISEVKRHPKRLSDLKHNLESVRSGYFWDIVTAPLAPLIAAHNLPYRDEQPLRSLLPDTSGSQEPAYAKSRLLRITNLPGKVVRKVRQKGVLRTAKLALSVAKTQVRSVSPTTRQRQFVFISHPINNTGAPIVLLQIVEEYVKKHGAGRVRVIAPGIMKEQRQYLKKLGVSVEQAVFGVGFRFIRLQLNLQPDDFVMMNTAAVYDNYRDFIMLWLRLGRLKHVDWFIHEDIEQLPLIHKEFLEPQNLTHVKELVDKDSLSLLFPSKRTSQEYEKLLQIDRSQVINLRVEVDQALITSKRPKDFETIEFLLSGTAGDGRKGQFLAISAFYRFLKDYYDKKPGDYRNFKLRLVAIDNDYVSRQIRWTAESLLGKRCDIHESMPKQQALEVTAACNAVICCSLNETFGLYIAEGMLMGHIVLRNNSAGVDEQLQDGVNGYLIDHTDSKQFASRIERLLNKTTTSNEQLFDMSQASQRIIANYGKYDYLPQIEATTADD